MVSKDYLHARHHLEKVPTKNEERSVQRKDASKHKLRWLYGGESCHVVTERVRQEARYDTRLVHMSRHSLLPHIPLRSHHHLSIRARIHPSKRFI